MKLLNNVSKYLVGLVFIFSGFVKAVDPLGSTYKFQDYFEAFGMDSLAFLALPLAILLSTMEFVIGFSLIMGTKKKITVWFLTLFMVFFTILTFILAIYNPVTDCGCFGDAIIMTNWETFGKNVVLMIFTIILFVNKDKYEVDWSNKKQIIAISLPTIFGILLSMYCYNNLPIIDFRPYKVGTYIPEKMIIPEDAPKAEYETTLTYKKDGVEKEFTMENLPDTTWEWVATNNKLISEGYVPPIHDFTIETEDGDDITEIVLNENKFTFLFIAYDLNSASLKNMDDINRIATFAKEFGRSNFIALSSSLQSDVDEFKRKTNAQFMFYTTDEITLKTMIRSNPGLVLLKNGTIVGKWHHKNIPSAYEIQKAFIDNPKYKNKSNANEALASLN